jgi:hypothetical protein
MPTPAEQPRFDQPVVDSRGLATQPWMNYWLRMASSLSQEDLTAVVAELQRRVDDLEDGQSLDFQILGQGSVSINGVPQPGNVVVITLEGDAVAPGNTQYYGTGPTGEKGWFPVSGAVTVAAGELTKAVGADGVTTLGLADLTNSGVGAALVKITRDAKGRVSGTSAATTDDLPAGTTNKYFPEAPNDGQVYGRKNLAWTVIASGGFGPPPTDGSPYVGLDGAWEKANAPDSRFWLIEYPLLTDQAGNQLTDQAGNFLMGNSPIVPPGWPSTTTVINNVSSGALQAMTLAEANSLVGVTLGYMVIITDLSTGNPEPCWYDATITSGTKWRRFSDRSIAT